jgi:hypothetical protein
MSYVTRKELHVLGTLFIGTRLLCPSAREFASGLVRVDIAIGGREVLELLAGRSYERHPE